MADVSPLIIFMNDPIGQMGIGLLVMYYAFFPDGLKIALAKKKKRSFVLKQSKDGVFEVMPAVYSNNLWKVFMGKDHIETFESEPEYKGYLFGQPAIAVYSNTSTAVPFKELTILKHIQSRFGIYTMADLEQKFSSYEDIKIAIEEHIEYTLINEDAIARMQNEIRIHNEKPDTDEKTRWKRVEDTNLYKFIIDYRNTSPYEEMMAKDRKTYDEWLKIKNKGVFLRSIETVNFSDLEKFYEIHTNPVTIRLNELNQIALERAKGIANAGSGASGGLKGGLDSNKIKMIAIGLAIVIIAAIMLPKLMASGSTVASGVQAAQTGMQGVSGAYTVNR